MTKTTSRHLLNILAEVPDFRNNRGKRHPPSAILGLAVIVMMCGYRSYTAIAEWDALIIPISQKHSVLHGRKHPLPQHSIMFSKTLMPPLWKIPALNGQSSS